ncbi:MAG: iolG 8 [Acidobacteria bacterium]|nr:iolG 8 [Acidobacteriota bacterium]
MESLDRRDFLKKSAACTAGMMASAPAIAKNLARSSPNETINVAVAGIRSRGFIYNGGGHCVNLAKIPNVRIVAVCDVDERLFPDIAPQLEKMTGQKPRTEVDFRRLLDDKDIHAISIATPDHWHALQTVWACQAGKDVYVEKPISYTVDEGRKMVQAARKYGRIVQVGTQSRSSPVVHEAIKLIRQGVLGEIYMGKSYVYRYREDIGHKPNGPIPEGVHWDLFLGPAPYRPFNENRFHYQWHWVWDTSTTEFGNNGTHGIDRIRLAMDKRVHPEKIHCAGNLYNRRGSDQEVPNFQMATFEYGDGTILETEVRCLDTNDEGGEREGSLLYGTEGWMYLNYSHFKTYLGREGAPGPSLTLKEVQPPVDTLEKLHFGNWIDCIRSRKWQDLNADILEGHLSTAMMHLGNISYRTGRKLHFNPSSEKFVNDEDADTYLTRNYRPPYVMPDPV